MSAPSLYLLGSRYREALEALSDPNLPAEAVSDTLEGLAGELEDKAVNVAKVMRNLESAASAIKEAEAEMAARRKALEMRVQWLKDYLKDNMERCGIRKIECPYFRLSVQHNPVSVDIMDEAAVPRQFGKVAVTWTVDKAAVRDAIESGQAVPGARLVRNTRLAVK